MYWRFGQNAGYQYFKSLKQWESAPLSDITNRFNPGREQPVFSRTIPQVLHSEDKMGHKKVDPQLMLNFWQNMQYMGLLCVMLCDCLRMHHCICWFSWACVDCVCWSPNCCYVYQNLLVSHAGMNNLLRVVNWSETVESWTHDLSAASPTSWLFTHTVQCSSWNSQWQWADSNDRLVVFTNCIKTVSRGDIGDWLFRAFTICVYFV